MDNLNLEIDSILDIVSYLTNRGKIRFLSASKELHALKDKIYYDEHVPINKVHLTYRLWYYDRFRHMLVHNLTHKLPKSARV